MPNVLRNVLLAAVPAFLAAASPFAGAAPAVAPIVTPTPAPGQCSITGLPASQTATLAPQNNNAEPSVNLSSPVTGTTGLNCSHRFIADINNGMLPPPDPLKNWITRFRVESVLLNAEIPTTAAACTALRLDSELVGLRLFNNGWTQVRVDNAAGKWAGNHCELPVIQEDIAMPAKGAGQGFDRYRVAATNGGHMVRVSAQIIGPKWTITDMQTVTPVGGAARPSPGLLYMGEPWRVNVTGNINNATGGDVCFYTITTEHVSNKHTTNSTHPNRFGAVAMPVLTERGDYHIVAQATASDPLPHCEGKAERTIYMHDPTLGWLTDVSLEGWGFRFPYGDAAGMPQFCANCGNIFQPAHNIGLLKITPIITGGTKPCEYQITQKFDNDSRTSDLSGLTTYTPGNPVVPVMGKSQAWPDAAANNPPFLNSWNNKTSVVTVTVKGLWAPTNPGMPLACNVLSGDLQISKTITFTDDQTKPHVFK